MIRIDFFVETNTLHCTLYNECKKKNILMRICVLGLRKKKGKHGNPDRMYRMYVYALQTPLRAKPFLRDTH